MFLQMVPDFEAKKHSMELLAKEFNLGSSFSCKFIEGKIK
jgi:hypothetical protein